MPNTARDLFAAAPDIMKRWGSFSAAASAGLDPRIKELVKVRASQINGCANCINLHVHWAREGGEADDRLHLLSAWHEAKCYDERERAALGWAEALTRLSQSHDLETARAALEAHFSESEQVALTMIVNDINGWNRIAVGFGIFVDPDEAKANVPAA